MIEAVTFDWWDTMALTTEEQDGQLRKLRIERLAKAVPDLSRTREALLQAYDRQQALLEEAWARNVDPAPEEQVQAFLKFAGLDRGDAVLAERVSEAFGGALLEIPPTLFPHVSETLEELKREGVAIGLVSNTGRTWGRYIRRVQDTFGIGRFFDVRVFSDEVGVRKPLAPIFEAALEGLGLPADRVVHVGDDIEADVIGAQDVGMRAVWFQTDRRGYRPRYQRRPPGSTDRADVVVHDLAEVPRTLRKWRS
jgi:putative hydrolase of the HAD superfamily